MSDKPKPADAKQFRVVRPNWRYPKDPQMAERLRKGEDVPLKARAIVAGPKVGKVVERADLPEHAITSGLANGTIEPVWPEPDEQKGGG